MRFPRNSVCFPLQILGILVHMVFQLSLALPHYHFRVKETPYTRLCSTKEILTVNGEYPGPTLRVHKGDTIYVTVHNDDRYNITIHWHGVRQLRNPWSDGTESITQCPIQPGHNFTQKVIFSDEEGTLWWHAHSDWSRATVYGAIIIYPKQGTSYPFPKPYAEVPILLGEWWKRDVNQILYQGLVTGADFNVSDSYTINGQPGDLYPCSKPETFRLSVEQGKTYLLRIINAAMNQILFFSIARHNLTVVGADAAYTKPLTISYIAICPGQTIDALLQANQSPDDVYYMAARAYQSQSAIDFDNSTTTAILQYSKGHFNNDSTPIFPDLPYYNDTNAAFRFFGNLRSLASKDHPVDVPLNITERILSTVSINTFICNNSCTNGTRLAASMNNLSFVDPQIDILEAYYYNIKGDFGTRFPSFPPTVFNFTSDNLTFNMTSTKKQTEVKLIPYGASVEVVFQDTNLLGGIDHPMHLHGYSFYVVGWGFGNFNASKDPEKYNLVDPVYRNTVTVPKSGWLTLRFKAKNPGTWFLHCHFERHLTWGMETVFIVLNGNRRNETLLPPPPDMPPCDHPLSKNASSPDLLFTSQSERPI